MFAIGPLRSIATVHAVTVWRFMLQFRSSFQLFFYFRDAFLRLSHSFPPRVFPVLRLDVSLDFIECYKFESWFRFGAIYFGSAICEVRHSIWSEKGRAFSEIKNNVLFLAQRNTIQGFVGILIAWIKLFVFIIFVIVYEANDERNGMKEEITNSSYQILCFDYEAHKTWWTKKLVG